MSSLTPRRWSLPFPVLLVGVTVLAFAPVLSAGFLNYDDPWLLVENPFLHARAGELPWRALFALDLDTRLALGAEYLPVRDLFVWLETRLFGFSPRAMHAAGLGLYAAALCALYGALVHTLPSVRIARWASLWFALAPVHAESVGWLASQKDLLALFFSALALYLHARGARLFVPLAMLLASLSKSMSVAVLPLFLAHDWVRGRRPDVLTYGALVAVTAASLAVHLYVGRLVGMGAAFPGGSRAAALATMGPVILRYLALSVLPGRGSVVHVVPPLHALSFAGLAGYGVCAGWLALAWRFRAKVVALAWAWFFLPLVPVCQLIFPLQNRMADRYLLWSALGPALLLAAAYEAALQRLGQRGGGALRAGACGLALALGLGCFERAVVFSDSVLLFSDALSKAESSALVPYQLGCAYEARGELGRAEEAYTEALRRGLAAPDGTLASAANNLASLLYRRGDLDGAASVLTRALAALPRHAKLNKNLAKVRAAQGL